jgi:predicted RNA-binding protein YlxR (DUF448 family)
MVRSSDFQPGGHDSRQQGTVTASPQRTCVGCRRRDDQAGLLRLVTADGASTVVVDQFRRLPGRGAWLHPQPECLAMAVKRRAFNRAFRGKVDSRAVEGYFQALDTAAENATGSHQPSNLKAGQKTDGNPMSAK